MTVWNGFSNYDDVNDAVEFDSVFYSDGNGVLFTGSDIPARGRSLRAPSVSVMPDDSELFGLGDWQPVSGFSSQWRYSGPIMHPSEYLGGAMARHVLETPGYYALTTVESETCDDYTLYGQCAPDNYQCSDEPAGWILVYMEGE